MLKVRGLKKHFGDLQVLKGIDLDVHEGEGSLCALDVKDYATGEMFLQLPHSGNRLSRVVPQRVQTTERAQPRHDELVLVLGEDVAVADVGEHLHREEVRTAHRGPHL